MQLWVRRIKKGLGYYEARERIRRRRFVSALRPTDTFLVGHPKSGNTWLAYMLAVLLFHDRDHVVTTENVGRYVPFVHAKDHQIRTFRRLPDPRVFRNEIPRYPGLYPRVVYLIREPRAVLVSFWHMYQVMYGDKRLSLESFVDQYLATAGIFETWNHGMPRWDRQVTEWVGRAGTSSHVTTLRYEDLIADRGACLTRLARFLGVAPLAEDIALAVDRGDFKAMQRVEERHGAEAYEGKAAGKGRFMRVGQVDGWQREMTPALAERIAVEFAPTMALVGYNQSAVAGRPSRGSNPGVRAVP